MNRCHDVARPPRLQPEAQKKHHYHINLNWNDEGECWIAEVPDSTCHSAHHPIPKAARPRRKP